MCLRCEVKVGSVQEGLMEVLSVGCMAAARHWPVWDGRRSSSQTVVVTLDQLLRIKPVCLPCPHNKVWLCTLSCYWKGKNKWYSKIFRIRLSQLMGSLWWFSHLFISCYGTTETWYKRYWETFKFEQISFQVLIGLISDFNLKSTSHKNSSLSLNTLLLWVKTLYFRTCQNTGYGKRKTI